MGFDDVDDYGVAKDEEEDFKIPEQEEEMKMNKNEVSPVKRVIDLSGNTISMIRNKYDTTYEDANTNDIEWRVNFG